jgi:hypothetical protein
VENDACIFKEWRWGQKNTLKKKAAGSSETPTTIIKTIRYMAEGRAIAQAVSRWLPTAVARVHMGFVVDKVALGEVFSDYLGFPHTNFCTITITYQEPG